MLDYGIIVSNYQIDSASSLSLDSWVLVVPNFGFINNNKNYRGVDSFVTSPNHNASLNQAFTGTLDAIVIRD
jgi:hypothetical protein